MTSDTCLTHSHFPRFPIYIPSKSRASIALTPRALDRMRVDYLLIVEKDQYDDYARYHDESRLLILDPSFQKQYETLDDAGDARSKGPGPARNFAWEHAKNAGHAWHWVMDDNIRSFDRYHRNQIIPTHNPAYFHVIESFALRWENLGMVGPQYFMFVAARNKTPPVTLNTRVFSCNLIRNDLPLRWRGRYNEDLILSIDMLKAGWCTANLNTLLQYKIPTQTMPGGNTEAFYELEGTLRKSLLAQQAHPDIVKVVHKYRGKYSDGSGTDDRGRWHHTASFSRFKKMGLIPVDPRPPDSTHQYDWATEPNPHHRKRAHPNPLHD